MNTMGRAKLLLACLSFSTLAFGLGKAETKCFEKVPLGSGQFDYCVTTTAGSKNTDLLYYFHGMGGNARSWSTPSSYQAQVREAWGQLGSEPPTVISLSFGQVWLLVEKNASPKSGLLGVVADFIIPQIEKGLPKSNRRLLLGDSMGGLNVLTLSLHRSKLFRKVAAVCPAIPVFSPFAGKDVIQDYIKRTGAKPERVAQLIALGRTFLATEKDWEAEAPLNVAEKNLNASSPTLYLSCGKGDEYGFFEGSESLAKVAAEKGAPFLWRPLWGGHCSVDIISLAKFLVAP